jgi:hypothetical protein
VAGKGNSCHAGNGRKIVALPVRELETKTHVFVWQINRRREQVLRVEPQVRRHQGRKAPEQQSGADQQHERERHLGRHEEAAQA